MSTQTAPDHVAAPAPSSRGATGATPAKQDPAVEERPDEWVAVCRAERIVPDTGVTALVDEMQVAVFRLSGDRVYALGNHDPCSGANVLSRGIVGDVDGRPFVASPIHKQRFDLETGVCIDEDSVAVVALETRLEDGLVEVRARATLDLEPHAHLSAHGMA